MTRDTQTLGAQCHIAAVQATPGNIRDGQAVKPGQNLRYLHWWSRGLVDMNIAIGDPARRICQQFGGEPGRVQVAQSMGLGLLVIRKQGAGPCGAIAFHNSVTDAP